MSYSEKLKSPEWDDKRKEILARDGFKCQLCLVQGTELHVHHKYYIDNTEPWDHPGDCLITLCDGCHKDEHRKLKELQNHTVNCFSRKFMADDITSICTGVLNIKSDHIPEMTASMLEWFLSDREALDIGFRMYFMCREKSEE